LRTLAPVRRQIGKELKKLCSTNTLMAFKPNYGLQRADRNRAAKARTEEKTRKREEQSAQRKAECIVDIKNSPDDQAAK
jgi:hypothetical protein